jgi:hypothetical protein
VLELLSGPHSLLDLNAVAVADDGLQQCRQWDDDVGLIFSEGRTLKKSWLIQLDGTACLRGDDYGLLIVDLQRDRPGEYLLIDALFVDTLYLYDKRAATRTALVLSGGINAMANIQVRTQDRFLSALGAAVKWRPLDISAAAATEATLTGVGSLAFPISSVPVWSRTRNPDVLALAYENGNILYYNHKTKTQAPGAAFIGANNQAWYSARHNIWIKLDASRQITVHAATPRPAALSAPSGAAALRGRVTTFTTRATGDAGEPVPDELIDWSLQSGSIGQLAAPQSRTDAAGYATVDYIAPVTGALGNATLKAELRY